MNTPSPLNNRPMLCPTAVHSVTTALTLLLGVAVLLAMTPPAAMAAPWSGSGTGADPWQLWDVDDLEAIGADPCYLDGYFAIMADIDLTGRNYQAAIIAPDTDPTTEVFDGTTFSGVIEGNNHTISNFTSTWYSGSSNHYVRYFGLIGKSYLATVMNLHMDNAMISYEVNDTYTIEAHYSDIGVIIGRAKNTGILNCSTSGNFRVIHTGLMAHFAERIGLLCGSAKQAIIQDCSTKGRILWYEAGTLGGLVGESTLETSFTQCLTDVRIDAPHCVGGMVGSDTRGTFTDCQTQGHLKTYHIVGGMAGTSDQSTFQRCRSLTTLWSYSPETALDNCCGGLVAQAIDTDVIDCCNDGDISGSYILGGIIGSADSLCSVTRCLAAGTIIRIENASGKQGAIAGTGSAATYTDNYGDAWATRGLLGVGDNGSIGPPDITLEHSYELKQQATYTNWDFLNTWYIVENTTYPMPRALAMPYRGDSTLDGVVDLNDLAVMAGNWLETAN